MCIFDAFESASSDMVRARVKRLKRADHLSVSAGGAGFVAEFVLGKNEGVWANRLDLLRVSVSEPGFRRLPARPAALPEPAPAAVSRLQPGSPLREEARVRWDRATPSPP